MSEIRTRMQDSAPFFPNMLNNGKVEVCLKEDVDKVIAEKDKEIAELQVEKRRLKRALYKAIANWAKCEERINNRDAYEASEYLPSAEDKFRKKAERWSEMETKCRAKAEGI